MLRNPDAWGPEASRAAEVTRMIGTLDQQTRLARVLVTVQDPLGSHSNEPPLILDTLMEVRIQGAPIADVVRLDRTHIRDRDTVWVMKDGKLEIRAAQIVFRDPDHAYVRSGVRDGEEVVATTLATVADGIGLRKLNDTADEESGK